MSEVISFVPAPNPKGKYKSNLKNERLFGKKKLVWDKEKKNNTTKPHMVRNK